MSDPNAVPDAELLGAVDDALEEGKRDHLAGGIVAEDIAEDLPISPKTVADRLSELADGGELAVVDGVNPATNTPRRSYLPADHPDTGTPDQPYR